MESDEYKPIELKPLTLAELKHPKQTENLRVCAGAYDGLDVDVIESMIHHYENIIIPKMQDESYNAGFETGKEESRIIFENTILSERIAEERQKIINWLFEPCLDHPIGQYGDTGHPVSPGIYPIVDIFRDHRYECVECMRQLKETKGEL